jgi:hypothetical protein
MRFLREVESVTGAATGLALERASSPLSLFFR